MPIHKLLGTTRRPVIVAAADRNFPPLFVARSGRNTVSIVDSAYVTISGLVLDGRGLAVDAVKAEGHSHWAHHITVENLVIRGHGNNQQTVGISTKCPAWDWVIRGNIIRGAGTGIYLGNSNGHDAFVGGLIEHNLITDTVGYNLQIKHQLRREAVAGMPSDRRITTIRHNVFSKAKGGSEAEMARPNVLVGHWPLAGAGENDLYQIYGNFFYQNPHEALFQGEGNIVFYNNLLVNDAGDAIHIQPHNDIPRRIAIFFNTVVASSAGVVIRRPENTPERPIRDYPQWVAANAVFAETPVVAAKAWGNLLGSVSEAADYLRFPYARLGIMDLTPVSRAASDSQLDPRLLREYTDADKDFEGIPRETSLAGAYGDVRLPQWRPKLEIKPLPVN